MTIVSVQRVPRLLLAGLSYFGDPFHAHAGWTETNEIGRLWQRLFSSQSPHTVMYEVHIQNAQTAATGEFEVFVGYEIDSIDGLTFDLCVKVLPETLYAIFTLQGTQIQSDEPILDNWLQENPYHLGLSYFVQRYDRRFKGVDRLAESELDFLVPVVRDEEQDDDPD